MANALGNQTLESKTNEPEEEITSYKLTTYKALELPKQFKNLIIAPFLNSLRYGNDLFKLIDKESYYTAYGRYVESLMQRPKCNIKLARLDEDIILGWSMWEETCLHYVWVKKESRRQGIGQALLPEFDTFSHITNKGLNIWVSKYQEKKFNPFV